MASGFMLSGTLASVGVMAAEAGDTIVRPDEIVLTVAEVVGMITAAAAAAWSAAWWLAKRDAKARQAHERLQDRIDELTRMLTDRDD